ncbi:MAG: DUF5658 family protein [Myxococcota bacterium]
MAAANGAREDLRFARSSAALLFLNLADGLFTLTFLQLELAEEANPLMRFAYQGSPLLFMVVKLAVVSGGVCLLWKNRDCVAAKGALTVGLTFYAAIIAWHLAFLLRCLTG